MIANVTVLVFPYLETQRHGHSSVTRRGLRGSKICVFVSYSFLFEKGQSSLTYFCITEFKEIRKEWKARKKEEEAQRKAAEEEARRRAQEEATSTTSAEPQPAVTSAQYVSGMPPQQRQLPPLSYQPSVSLPNGVQFAATSSAPTAPMESMQQQYGQQQMYQSYPPTQQFAGNTQQMYAGQQQRAAATPQSNGNNATTTGGEEPHMDTGPGPDISAASTYSS